MFKFRTVDERYCLDGFDLVETELQVVEIFEGDILDIVGKKGNLAVPDLETFNLPRPNLRESFLDYVTCPNSDTFFFLTQKFMSFDVYGIRPISDELLLAHYYYYNKFFLNLYSLWDRYSARRKNLNHSRKHNLNRTKTQKKNLNRPHVHHPYHPPSTYSSLHQFS